MCRSACPAAFARPSIYAAKRLCCGPGEERRDPTKQFYIKLLIDNTVILPYDVGRALRLPAVRNRLAERILPEADLHRILSLETNSRNRAILTLLYASGVRVSELCGLCWRDLQPNGDGGQITVLGKGGVTRAVQVPASVWKLLNGLRDACSRPGDPVFRSRNGN